MNKILSNDSNVKLLDFGCGDGAYCIELKKAYPETEIDGCDLSHSMIDTAKTWAEQEDLHIQFVCSDGKIPWKKKYTHIMTIATLAHILDKNILEEVLADFYNHMEPGGKVIVFEQCGSYNQKFNYAIRRKKEEYIDLFTKQGYQLLQCEAYSRLLFNLFDHILRIFFGIFMKMQNVILNKRIHNFNYYKSYMKLSELNLKITRRVDQILKTKRCNVLMVFEKANQNVGSG